MIRYILFLALSINAFAELRPLTHSDSDRFKFFVHLDEGVAPSLVYKFDGKLMGEVPEFWADWTHNIKKPEHAISKISFSNGGGFFAISFQIGRIAEGELLYECDYTTGKLTCLDDVIQKMCEKLRTDPKLKTFPTSPNRSAYNFVSWVSHDTFIWEIRTDRKDDSVYHSYCRFRGRKGDNLTVKNLNIFMYNPHE